jgi:hypothetical protein
LNSSEINCNYVYAIKKIELLRHRTRWKGIKYFSIKLEGRK